MFRLTNLSKTKQLVSCRMRISMEVCLARVFIEAAVTILPTFPWFHPGGHLPTARLRASWLSLHEGLLWLVASVRPVHRDLITSQKCPSAGASEERSWEMRSPASSPLTQVILRYAPLSLSKGPQQGSVSAARRANLIINLPFTGSPFPNFPSVLPGTNFHRNYLHLNACLGACFWGNPN